MSLLRTLKEINRRETFRPGFLGLIINANYFIKRGIYKGILRHAGKMKGKLLDFGCGNKPYKDLFRVEEYIGLDIANEAHDHSQESIEVLYDGKKIPFEDGHFDAVFSSEVFEHVFNLEPVLAEISRVLKKDGLLLVTLPFVWPEHEKPNDFARYTSFGIKDLLERHKFSIEVHERSTTFIETVAQLRLAYIYSTFLSGNVVLRGLAPLIVFPLNLLASACSAICPSNPDLYLNHIIVARKKA